MLKKTIVKLRQNLLRPKEEYPIENIFKTIKIVLAQNKNILNKCSQHDCGRDFDVASAQEIFTPSALNNYGNTSSPFINEYGRVSENMVPFGIVGLQVEGKMSLNNYLEIIKVCLETRNTLIIKPFTQSKTLEVAINLINNILKQTVDFNEIVLTEESLLIDEIDLLIFVGEKTKFKNLNFKNDKIFLGVGQYELYVDEVIDEKMIDFAKNNGIKIYKRKEGVYDEINENGANYCTAIMSGNKERIREFITNIKSSYVLVNMSPALVDNVNLFPEQLLKRKTTIIFE